MHIHAQKVEINKEKKKQHFFVATDYHIGTNIQGNVFLQGDNLTGNPINKYRVGSIKFGWQNPGNTDWQNIYNFPYYGVGLLHADYDSDEIGKPYAIFGYFGIPTHKWSQFYIAPEMRFGLAWNWNHYDPITNPKNIAVGSPLTSYIGIALNGFYKLTNQFDIGASFAFDHFSIGKIVRPNKGLNSPSLGIKLRYFVHKRPDFSLKRKVEYYQNHKELDIILRYATHEINAFGGKNYPILGLSASISEKLSSAYKVGVGFDLNYLWSISIDDQGNALPHTLKNFTTGLYVQNEMIINRLSVVCGLGIYVSNANYGKFKQLYQRLGLKYHASQNHFLGFNIRATGLKVSEFIEFNVGYRIVKK